MNLTEATWLKFTEIKNGSTRGRTFESTPEKYINSMYDVYSIDDFGADFESLSVEKQLDVCIDLKNEANASHTYYEIPKIYTCKICGSEFDDGDDAEECCIEE